MMLETSFVKVFKYSFWSNYNHSKILINCSDLSVISPYSYPSFVIINSRSHFDLQFISNSISEIKIMLHRYTGHLIILLLLSFVTFCKYWQFITLFGLLHQRCFTNFYLFFLYFLLIYFLLRLYLYLLYIFICYIFYPFYFVYIVFYIYTQCTR
jgi:hypothetical protein